MILLFLLLGLVLVIYNMIKKKWEMPVMDLKPILVFTVENTSKSSFLTNKYEANKFIYSLKLHMLKYVFY